ncbi:MAG TPA: YaeQ family protein [Burkholderiales bacterium]|jgi:uncharacterized protein YaeQ
MALKSTIYKTGLQVADMDRNYYAEHALTLACHPSETAERMMVRLLVFALNAHERLGFGRGLSDVDDPDLSLKDLTGQIELWIEVGQPDEKAILKACGRADQVKVYAYGNSTPVWWKGIETKLTRARNLSVYAVPPAEAQALGQLVERTMQLQCTVQDGEVWVRDETRTVEVHLETLREVA